MNMLLAAALGGSLLGFTLLWAYGVLAALLGAQLGAISLAFLMCPILALRRTKVERKQSAGFKLVSRAWPGEDVHDHSRSPHRALGQDPGPDHTSSLRRSMRDLAQSITRMDAGLHLRCKTHET